MYMYIIHVYVHIHCNIYVHYTCIIRVYSDIVPIRSIVTFFWGVYIYVNKQCDSINMRI